MKSRWPIIVLLMLSLSLRLAWGLTRPAELAGDLPDQNEYLAIARHLLIGEGLRFRDDRFGADEVVAFRSPGYPAFVAMLGGSPLVVYAVQAVLDTLTVLAAYLLARRWLGERAALLAAALVAFNPFLIFFTGLLLSETLFTAALAWGFSLLGRRKWIGLLPLAVAVIVRPAAMFLPPLAGAVAGWPSKRRAVAQAVGGALVSFLTLLPWAYRNHQMLGQWIWTTTNTGQTAYDGFHDGATGASDLAALPRLPELLKLNEVGRNDLLSQRAKDWMRANPGRSAALAVRKVARMWSLVPLSDEYGSARNRLIAAAYSLPLLVLAAVGLVRCGISAQMKTFCLLPALYFTAGAMITVGSLRYLVPAEPIMAVLAASAFAGAKDEGGRMKDEKGNRVA